MSHGRRPNGSPILRPLPTASFGTMALGSAFALGAELFLGFALCFAPGWANMGEGGPSIRRVWSAGMTACLFVMSMTVGVGLGGLLGLMVYHVRPGGRNRSIIFAWPLIWSALTVFGRVFLYRAIYASALEMWPNGYPGLP